MKSKGATAGDIVERVTPGTLSWIQYGAEHMQRYEYFAQEYAGKKVLDAACGTGYGSDFIAGSASSVTGLDISPEAIEYCNRNYKLPGLAFRQFDLSRIHELREKYDVVVSFETIEHLAAPVKFIHDAADVLQPGGKLICSTPNKKRHSDLGSDNKFHLCELSWEDFRNAFQKRFEIEACYHQSESIEYMRYMELRHLLHQEHARQNAFLTSRIERWMRNLFGRPFKPIPFFRQTLDQIQKHEVRIETIDQPEDWHKTFIIKGRLRG